jgi:hypothetical protein
MEARPEPLRPTNPTAQHLLHKSPSTTEQLPLVEEPQPRPSEVDVRQQISNGEHARSVHKRQQTPRLWKGAAHRVTAKANVLGRQPA